MRSTAEGTYGIFRDSAGLAILSFDRFNCFAVAKPVILVPEQPVLFDERLNDRQLIREEFLVFGAVDLIMSPLFELLVLLFENYFSKIINQFLTTAQ